MLRALDISSCTVVAPSASAWSVALAAHLGLLLLGLLPMGIALYFVPRHIRTRFAVVIGFAAGVGTPLIVAQARQSHPEKVTWMVAFLASTFGFQSFFKSFATAFASYPEGADADLRTWLLWFTSLPEPLFAKGKPVQARGALLHRVLLFLVKGAALFVVLSALRHAEGYSPFEAHPLLNSLVHLWTIYLFAAFCLDVGSLLVLLQGVATEPGFSNPLLASRSLRENWGERWNRPVNTFLKRAVYVPARRRGYSAAAASLLTFLCSGLLHEYNFSLHNASAYQPGHASLFFITMGLLMIAEAALASRAPPLARRIFRALPSALVSLALLAPVLPFFGPLFMRSWIQSGFLESVMALVPHLQCDGNLQ